MGFAGQEGESLTSELREPRWRRRNPCTRWALARWKRDRLRRESRFARGKSKMLRRKSLFPWWKSKMPCRKSLFPCIALETPAYLRPFFSGSSYSFHGCRLAGLIQNESSALLQFADARIHRTQAFRRIQDFFV